MRRRLLRQQEDIDPMSVVSNLFDVAMVFAVALMVALVSRYNMTEMFSQDDFTMVKNPGKDNMEIITKEGQKSTATLHLRINPPRIIKRENVWEWHTNWKTAKLYMFLNNYIEFWN